MDETLRNLFQLNHNFYIWIQSWKCNIRSQQKIKIRLKHKEKKSMIEFLKIKNCTFSTCKPWHVPNPISIDVANTTSNLAISQGIMPGVKTGKPLGNLTGLTPRISHDIILGGKTNFELVSKNWFLSACDKSNPRESPSQIAKQLHNRQHPCKSLQKQLQIRQHTYKYDRFSLHGNLPGVVSHKSPSFYLHKACYSGFFELLLSHVFPLISKNLFYVLFSLSSREKKGKLNPRSLLTWPLSTFKVRSDHHSMQSKKIIYFSSSQSRDLSSTSISFFRGSTSFSSSYPPR